MALRLRLAGRLSSRTGSSVSNWDKTVIKSLAITRLNRKGNFSNSKAALSLVAEEGGLYCSFSRNSLVFCHFIRKTRIFCCLRPSLSSRIRLSSALLSLLWTSKVPKKSNMSNKLRISFLRLL